LLDKQELVRGVTKLPTTVYANSVTSKNMAWGQSYKTFFGRYLQKARAFVPGKPFQPSLMFAGNARA
jgi:hypothetical protein